MRYLGTLLVILLVTGCNQPSDSEAPFAKRNNGSNTQNSVDSSPKKGAASLNAKTAAFKQDLERLVDLAYQTEEKQDYAGAARIWGQLQQIFKAEHVLNFVYGTSMQKSK